MPGPTPRRLAIAVALLVATAACGPRGPEPVTLEASTITWETYAYELTDFNTVRRGSFDGETTVERTFDTWVLANEFLTVTLLPEFGGRILSIVYEPTGHEQLYRNPIGVPYQIDTGVFYYDWLMVYGGIFPTFPGPEHGKAWFLPWDVEIVEQTDERVTIAMSFVDDEGYPFAPRQYESEATGLELTYEVTLEAGRAAVDARVIIDNPTAHEVEFEYWTSATLSPGSDPDDPRVTAGAEIIAPIERITIPSLWSEIAGQEDRAGLPDVYRFDVLRSFANWPDLGIAYAFPDMGGADHWGVINHDNGEGLIRIADNSVTPGLKMWTWGYPGTVDLDPADGPDEARPYIELWAGLTRRFFEPTTIDAGGTIRFDEVYAPTVGLSDVTHANGDVIVDVAWDGDDAVDVDVFGLRPRSRLTATLSSGSEPLAEESFVVEEGSPHRLRAEIPRGGAVEVVVVDAAGNVVFEGISEPGGR